MDRIKLIAVLCAGVVASQALAQQHSKPMRNPQSAAERQAMQTEQEKIRRFKTDEGEMGQTRWTEYTVNPAAKGEGTLVLVLGGRDSLGSSSPPDELPSLIAYAKTQVKGKVVFIVPKPRGGGVGGRMMRNGAMFGGENALTINNLPKLVKHFTEKHAVSKGKVLATGTSMGGHQLLGLLNDDPGLVTKALVVASAGDTSALADVRTQVRMVHGDCDDAIPVFKAQATADAINKSHPGTASLVTVKGKDHVGAMKEAFGKKDNLKWLFN